MIAIPAIDLRDGCCVQLVGGSFDDERVRLPDPLAIAEQWQEAGFRRLHVVDLDAAVGKGSNLDVIRQLAGLADFDVQVGGGLRSTEAIERVFNAGAQRVIIGTRALRDRRWLATVANRWPDRIIVAADARNGSVVTHGWTEDLDASVIDVIEALGHLPLSGFLITAVDREGRMAGPDTELIRRATRATKYDIIASGGVGTRDHLAALASSGATATVIGMALYAGALDPRSTALEFNA